MALSIQIVISDYNISTGLPADQDSLPEKSACEPVIPSVIDQSQAMSVGAESTSVEEESLAGSQRRFERKEEESLTESLPMPEREIKASGKLGQYLGKLGSLVLLKKKLNIFGLTDP